MDVLQVPHLPPKLYRVQYPDCQTRYSEEQGLKAQDTTTRPQSVEELGRFVTQSFTWGSALRNPFINLFSDKEYAVNWAISESERTGKGYLVLTINTRGMRSNVIKLSDAVKKLGVRIPQRALSHESGAYLCLHSILAKNICAVETSESLSREREDKRWAREEFVDHSIRRPDTHWSFELNGYYTSDEEAEQCNINGNIERLLDGFWD